MSRIGKQPVSVPAGVKVSLQGRTISISGPVGSLTFTHAEGVTVKWTESEKSIVVSIPDASKDNAAARAVWGTTRALIRNMIEGVTKGYEENMEVVGVGWTAAVQGQALKLVVGFANPILMPIPPGVKVTVDKQFVKVQGADKQVVGHFAAEMRRKRKPEPYNGKGIKYVSEVIKKKQGKQFGA